MGNAGSDPRAASSLLTSLSQDYQEVRQDSRGVVLLQKQSQNTFLLKEYTFCSQQLFNEKVRQLKTQIDNGPQEHIISPVKLQSKIFNNFCSSSYKVYAIFQYPQVTLREEISARQKEDKNFEQTQLWSILQSCCNALGQLKAIVSLNPDQIFINPDGHLKIIHDDLMDQNYRAVVNENVYYAPQKLKNFTRLDSQLSVKKESIFSMGMTMLQAAQLAPISSCYNFHQCIFNEDVMLDMLDRLTERYSLDFLDTLGNILQVNPNRRASVMEIQKVLDSYWNSEQFEGKESQTSNFCQEQQEEVPLQSQQESFNKQTSSQTQVLVQKNTNKQRLSEKAKETLSLRHKTSQMSIPEKTPPNFKLQQPKVAVPAVPEPKYNSENIPMQTPKNPPAFSSQQSLYTDPKLLAMIRQDLADITQLKKSAFYESSKYTFMYPQTQSILNSIKNLDANGPATNRTVPQFTPLPLSVQPGQEEDKGSQKRDPEPMPTKLGMKKDKQQLIYVVQTYQNGRRYEGTTLNERKHGKGKLIFEDGAYYEGQFKQDKMNGKGTLYYSQDNPAYEGEWYEDQFHGQGILYNENPKQLDQEYDFQDMNEVQDYWVRYQGQFVLDNKSGQGKLFLTNGETFDGYFSQDSINGHGKYHCLNGEIIQGIWDANILVEVNQDQS